MLSPGRRRVKGQAIMPMKGCYSHLPGLVQAGPWTRPSHLRPQEAPYRRGDGWARSWTNLDRGPGQAAAWRHAEPPDSAGGDRQGLAPLDQQARERAAHGLHACTARP